MRSFSEFLVFYDTFSVPYLYFLKYIFYIGKITWCSVRWVRLEEWWFDFPGRGEWHSQYPGIFTRGQTGISANRSIFKPEYSSISRLFLKCNCGDKMDTFFGQFEDCDRQEMGVWRTKSWESYERWLFQKFQYFQYFQKISHLVLIGNIITIISYSVVNTTTKIHPKNGGAAYWQMHNFWYTLIITLVE